MAVSESKVADFSNA